MEWSASPEIVTIGPVTLRYYSLLFALGFILGFDFMKKVFQRENRDQADLDTLLWTMLAGTIIGARLGHCFFYNADYYLSHPLELFKVWNGGLASHGAAVGIFTALYVYSKKKSEGYMWLVDRLSITVALAGCFIRLGNFFNSEIYGKAADVPWAVVFTRVDFIPRHPTQLYESIGYLLIYLFMRRIYWKSELPLPSGKLLGWFLVLVFGWRFVVEFFKEAHTDFGATAALNLGQLMSIPLIIAGLFFLKRSSRIDA